MSSGAPLVVNNSRPTYRMPSLQQAAFSDAIPSSRLPIAGIDGNRAYFDVRLVDAGPARRGAEPVAPHAPPVEKEAKKKRPKRKQSKKKNKRMHV